MLSTAASNCDCSTPGGKVRRFKEFFAAAHTWSRVRRIVARVEAGSDGTDTRFIVTTLGHGSGRSLYQDLYCRRGQAENHIKAWETHLAADRTSCPKATANQFRLFLHAGAYWLLWSLRALTPRAFRSGRVAQLNRPRLRLIKVAARIVEMKTRIKVHLPTSAPDQSILHLVLGRLPAAGHLISLGACCASLPMGSSSPAKPPTQPSSAPISPFISALAAATDRAEPATTTLLEYCRSCDTQYMLFARRIDRASSLLPGNFGQLIKQTT